jgi:hypothetical protein
MRQERVRILGSNLLALAGVPRAIAENVEARGSLGEFSVSQTGLLAFSSAGNLVRSVAIVSRDGTTVETMGRPGAYEAVFAHVKKSVHRNLFRIPLN